MFLDNTSILSDGVTTTTAAASSNYIDTLAAGGANEGAWFVAMVETTAFTVKNGAPYVNFQLQTSPATNFTDAGTTTLVASGALYAADLTASTIVFKARIPLGAKRYLRGYYAIPNYSAGSADFSACSYSMFITHDADELITGKQ